MLKTKKINSKWSEIKMSELELNKLIIHFAQCNKSEAKSPKTVSWYTETLKECTKFLAASGRECALGELSVASVRDFIISQQGKGLSPYTVQGRVRALKAFSSWLFREGYTPENLLTRIKLPKSTYKSHRTTNIYGNRYVGSLPKPTHGSWKQGRCSADHFSGHRY